MKLLGQNRLELALLGLIAIVCAGLSILQYRWTGEVSRAERVQLRSGLNDQVLRLARAFDEEIRENCRVLLPDGAQLREAGVRQAHLSRYRAWASSHEEGLFTHIAIAAPEHGILNLYSLEREGRIASMEWPPGWEGLRASMTGRMRGGGPPPSIPPNSTLIEYPIFDSSDTPREGRREFEWMIFEVSQEYIRSKMLPRLLAEYLTSRGDAVYDVSVSWSDPRGSVVFSTRGNGSSVASGADATVGIFSLDTPAMAGGRRDRPSEGLGPTRWVLAARHREGSLDAVVSHARTRNLLTSLALISMLAGAAWALVRYTARSRRLSEMQFRFAAGVSHDLRTPLTAIRGAAFNLADGVVTEPAKVGHYANLILRNAEELTAMIENVLAFSASLHSSKEERREIFAVGDLLDHAVATMAQEIEKAGCRMELTVAPDLPGLTGDPIAIEQAFRNLIANAARHGAQGRWIGVSAARSGEGVEVRVCDRGPGIVETERERIFEPFYRGEQTRASQVRGTGLGLSLVKDAVERHRGTIAVNNSPAGGAQFTVWLPAT